MAIIATEQHAFDAALKQAKPGDQILYHVGVLAKDREGHENLKLNLFARHVYNKSIIGDVHLVQRRLETNRYEYLAVRSSKGFEQAEEFIQLAGAA